MKRKTLTVRERAEAALSVWSNWGGSLERTVERAIKCAVRAALRKRRGQIKALEIEQVNHIEIIERNAEARIDAARAEGRALRKRRGAR